jgi:hypothetical protein
MWEKLSHVWDLLRHLVEPFLPGAIGAAVAQAWEPGLSLRQRTIQWVVGLTFAVFVVPGVGHVFNWGTPLVDAVQFVVGVIAFNTVLPLQRALIEGSTGALKTLPEVFRSWARKPGTPPDGDA